MLENSLMEFNLPVEFLSLVVVLYVLGRIVKGTKYIKNELIPVILLVVGIGFAIALLGVTPNAIMNGIIVTGLAVYGENLIKQYKQGLGGDK